MLDSEDVAMQVCDPLPALGCEVQIAQGGADIRLDTLPEECWIGNDQIGWTRQSKLFGGSGFHELIEQRIQLLRIAGIGQLTDQVGGADKARLAIGFRVIIVIRHRKAGQDVADQSR